MTVEYITFREKKYPVRVSYMVLNRFKEKTGKSFEEISGEGMAVDFKVYEPILFLALTAGHVALDMENPLPEDKMEEVLDECLDKFLVIFQKGMEAIGSGVKKEVKPNRAARRAEKKGK